MTNLKNKKEKFFGAVSKNLAVFTGKTKKEVREQINERKITKNKFVMFIWWSNGRNTIIKKSINNPRFKLTGRHHTKFTIACLKFLNSDEGES